MRIVEKIKELDVEFKRLTGHEAFGYLAAPTPTSERYAFATGEVFTAGDKAYEYMLELLHVAGTDPGRLPYPLDQPLSPKQETPSPRG